MKEILALLFSICFGVVTFYLAATKQIDAKITLIFLVFTLIGGLSITNYDIIKKIKWKDVEVETFERRVTEVKEQALEEIRKDVEKQKTSIARVTETLIKIAMVLADGARRYGGIPEGHRKQIQAYKESIKDYLDPKIDQEINRVISELDRKALQK